MWRVLGLSGLLLVPAFVGAQDATTPNVKLPEKVVARLPIVQATSSGPVRFYVFSLDDPSLSVKYENLPSQKAVEVREAGRFRVLAWSAANGTPTAASECLLEVLAPSAPGLLPDPPTSDPSNPAPKPLPDTPSGTLGTVEVVTYESFKGEDGKINETAQRDARMLQYIWGELAVVLELDGERETPRYMTVTAALGLVSSRTSNTLAGSSLPALRAKYPTQADVFSKTVEELVGLPTDPDGEALTPQRRDALVSILWAFSRGCATARE